MFSVAAKFFYKSRHGLLVLGRMARTRADVREAELLEDLADRALVVSDAEALGHDLLQVHPAPAHDSMHGALRAGFNDLGELRQLLRREARPVAFRPAVLEPFSAPFIEAVHPVPQRLAVHATDPRGIGPAHPIQHRRKRQRRRLWLACLEAAGQAAAARRSKSPPSPSPLSPWHEISRAMGISSTSRRKSPASQNGRPLVLPAWYARPGPQRARAVLVHPRVRRPLRRCT